MRISDWSSDVCSSDLRHATGNPTQRQRNITLGGPRKTGRNAIDQLDFDAMLAHPLRLFAAPAEDARVAALEAHYALAMTGITQHQSMDTGLGRGTASAARPLANDSRAETVLQHSLVAQHGETQPLGFAPRAYRSDSQKPTLPRTATTT